MTNAHADEMPSRRAAVIAAVLCAALVASAAAQARSTAGTSCSAKADVCEGPIGGPQLERLRLLELGVGQRRHNCTVRLRLSPELANCRKGCSRRKVECLKTGTWRPLLSGQGARRN